MAIRLDEALDELRAAGLLISVEGPGGRVPVLTSICSDSRDVCRGGMFVAVRGTRTDGLKHAREAIRGGAVAVLADRAMRSVPAGVVRIRVRDAAKSLGILASAAFKHPTSQIGVYGVTGTNGKTTTTYLIRHLLTGMGCKTSLLGTVNEEIPGRPPVASALTTPDILRLNRFFRRSLDAGCGAAVCEVSSHSLDQRRSWGIRFNTVIFTNLTQDHLDYHKTMGEYFEAKKRLFTEYEYERAVVNVDDPFGRRIASQLKKKGRPPVTFGRRAGATVRILSSSSGLRGIRARMTAFGRRVSLNMKLIGDYNLSNAAAALAACGTASNVMKLARIMSTASAPPGRMERVDAGQKFVVLVDYAHTPDALDKLLRACRRIKPRRLICVFGCGGDRDRTKRSRMGRVATRLADLTIVTSDNPRTENPNDIIDDIRPGLRGRPNRDFVIEPDRRMAIEMACRMASRGETVVIAGKGHETCQIIGTTKYPFDDRKIAHAALSFPGAG